MNILFLQVRVQRGPRRDQPGTSKQLPPPPSFLVLPYGAPRDNLPAVQGLGAHENVQECRLPDAVSADDSDSISAVELVREIVENFRRELEGRA